MSIDLKGNTNYVAFHDLEQGLVVPRTNLSAVDMNVGNGLEVYGDTINIREADAIQIVNGASTTAVITSEALRKALFMGSTSILDVTKQTVTASAGSITSTFDSDGMVVTGASADGVGGIKFVGPLAGVSEKEGKFLLVFDVYVSVSGSVTGFSCTGDEDIVFETIPGYTLSKTEQGSWVRCAALIDTTAGVYTGSLYFNVATTSNTEYSFKLGNVRVQDATGLNSDEIQYLVLAGKINTTVEGATVVVDGNNPYVFIPGEGVKIQEGVISMDTSKAPAADIINNTGDMLLSNKNFNAALSSGKAVDVTSTPSASTGTVNTGIGVKGQISWTGSGNATFGFYDADHAFPKFAGGLVYLMEADVTNNGSANITLSANNAINDTLPVTLAPGRKVRIAFLFDTATTGYFSLTSSGAFDILFDYLREYEVTGCSDEARKYIAQLPDPDDYNKYYLVDEDEVNPWLYIINMHDAPVVTLMAGLAYKIHANDGNVHTLMVDTIPPNTYGRSAHLELYVGETSAIELTSPLRLAHGNSFTANTLNNCSVIFQDGLATLTVDSVESSFIINLAGSTYTTESGTVYYGISTSESTYLVFNSDTNGLDADMHGAAANDDKEFYGNGIANTIMVGAGTFGTHKADMQELTLKGATISGSNINLISNVGVQDALVNNATVSVAANTTLKLVGSTNSTSAISGTGKVTFDNGAVVDASQNKAGAVLISTAASGLIVVSGVTVTVKGLNGYTTTVTNKTGQYLLANGDVVTAAKLYTVSVTAASGNNTLNAGLTAATYDDIIFAHGVDGSTCSAGTASVSENVAVLGNAADKTFITGNVSVTSGKNLKLQDMSVSGSTFSGAGSVYYTYITLDNVTVGNTRSYFKSVVIPEDSVVTETVANSIYTAENIVLDGTLIIANRGDRFVNNTTIISPSKTGVLKDATYNATPIFMWYQGDTLVVDGVKLTGVNDPNLNSEDESVAAICRGTAYFTDCEISGNTGGIAVRVANVTTSAVSYTAGTLYATNCSFFDNVGRNSRNGLSVGRVFTVDGAPYPKAYLKNCVFGTNQNILLRAGDIYLDGGTYSHHVYNHPAKDSYAAFWLIAGSTISFTTTTSDINGKAFATGTQAPISIGTLSASNDWTDEGMVTFNLQTGNVAELSACRFYSINYAGVVATNPVIQESIVITAPMQEWKATNITFASPLDASKASTVKLTGTTFTEASKISNPPMRIQLPANTTLDITGNTNAADTKIIQAPIIVVGNDPTAPAGEATIVGGTVSPLTISGIGTYIDKEGDNDFVEINSTNVVPVDGSTTGAKYLGTILSATTGETGANRFAKIDSGAVAVVNEATNAVNKQIITHDYEPILGGTFSLTSATVDEATKTVAIQSGGTMSVVDVIGGKDSTIDLGGTNVNVSSDVTASVSGCTFTGGSASILGGNFYIAGGSAEFTSCTVQGGTATYGGGFYVISELKLSSCVVSGNSGENGKDIYVNGSMAKLYVDGCTVDQIRNDGATVYLKGACTVGRLYYGVTVGSVVISSGAILDLTGNTNATPIAPGGAIIASGDNTFIYGPSSATTTAYITGASFTQISSGTKLTFGCLGNITVDSGVWSASNAVFSRGSGAGDMIVVNDGNVNLTNISASNTAYNYIGIYGGTVTLNGCATDAGAPIQFRGSGGVLVLSGSNFIGRGISHLTGSSGGSMIIADKAIINESGGFIAIDPGQGITFGASVTIINNAGTSSLLNGGASGTCSKINTNGTIA